MRKTFLLCLLALSAGVANAAATLTLEDLNRLSGTDDWHQVTLDGEDKGLTQSSVIIRAFSPTVQSSFELLHASITKEEAAGMQNTLVNVDDMMAQMTNRKLYQDAIGKDFKLTAYKLKRCAFATAPCLQLNTRYERAADKIDIESVEYSIFNEETLNSYTIRVAKKHSEDPVFMANMEKIAMLIMDRDLNRKSAPTK